MLHNGDAASYTNTKKIDADIDVYYICISGALCRVKGEAMKGKTWVVLIVEDDAATQIAYQMALEDAGIKVISAPTLDIAVEQLATQDRIDAVVLDGRLCKHGRVGVPDTLEFAKMLKNVFAGPVIAASDSKDCNDALKEAGCQFSSAKMGVPEMVLGLFVDTQPIRIGQPAQ